MPLPTPEPIFEPEAEPVPVEDNVPDSAPRARTYADTMASRAGEASRLRDTELYLHLGYESELSRAEEQKRVDTLRTESEKIIEGQEFSPAPRGVEFTARTQVEEIEAAYDRASRLTLVRLAVALVGALFGLIYDLLPTLLAASGVDTPFVTSFAYPLFEFVWIAACILPFVGLFGTAVKSLWNFEPTRYCVSLTALLVAALHSLVAVFTPADSRPPLFGGIALFMLLIAAVSEYVVLAGEHAAFSVVSSGKISHILTRESTPASEAYHKAHPEADRADAPTIAASKKSVLTAVSTTRLADFFARTARYNPYMGRLNYLLPVALLAAVICAGVSVALNGEVLGDGMRVFTSTYLACLPAAYVTAMTLPLWLSNRILRGKGTAVVGTAAYRDYTDGDTELIFADSAALTATFRKEITLRSDSDPDTWRRMANAAFRLMDSPLATTPDPADPEIPAYRMEIAESGEGFVRLYLVDDEHRTATELTMGSHAALAARGIRLPKVTLEPCYKKSPDSHVLYIAFDGQFHLAYAVEYRVDEAFAAACRMMPEGHGMSVAGYDPMVTSAGEGITPLRATRAELPRRTRASGVIATDRSTDLVYPLAACRQMKEAYRLSHMISWIALPVGFLISLLLTVLGGAVLQTSALLIVWQMLTVGAMVLVSMLTVRSQTLLEAKPEPTQAAPAEDTADTPNDNE